MDNNLRDIVNRGQDVLAELENEVNRIENSDLTKENTDLKAAFEQLSADHEKTQKSLKTLEEQNKGLQNALYEQVYSEKTAILDLSKKKLDIYFKKSANEQNKLDNLEAAVKSKIDKMTQVLRQNNIDAADDIYKKLDEVEMKINIRVTEARKQHAENTGAFSQNELAEFERLKNEQITDEQILAVTKKNNIERIIGLNVLNAIGVLLIIIGTITVARLTYMYIPDELKGLMMFALGGAMLAAGEFLNRKKPNIFSLGITAGGVAVLYVALATSYFLLDIIARYPALGVCVLITAVAFFLSTRYNSQTILAFALVGGYLPMFSQSGGISFFYGAMVYFVLLNLLALLVAFHKKWTIPTFIGLALNTIGTAYICMNFVGTESTLSKIIVIAYIFFAFLNYTLIPIISTYRVKSAFHDKDIALIGINTFVSAIIMHGMFYIFGWSGNMGILAIIFAAAYLALGMFIERKFPVEKKMRALFFLTGMAFVVLVVPFQFDLKWLSMGWLVEGLAISLYGILKNDKHLRNIGHIICGLCLMSFLLIDLLAGAGGLFTFKYFAITAGSISILAAYIYKKTLSDFPRKFYKYAVIVNLWFFTLHICYKLSDSLFAFRADAYYMTGALAVFMTFALAFIAPRIKIISDSGVKMISGVQYVVGIAALFLMNSTLYANDAALAVISLVSVLALHDLVKLSVLEKKLGVEWYPLVVSGYFVALLTQALITQFGLSITSMWLTIIYVLTAFAWIVFGFAKRYSLIRKLGLGLSLLSVVKLFIVDLQGLTSTHQIASYFSLGATLIAISFVYQYFNKRLELKMDAES